MRLRAWLVVALAAGLSGCLDRPSAPEPEPERTSRGAETSTVTWTYGDLAWLNVSVPQGPGDAPMAPVRLDWEPANFTHIRVRAYFDYTEPVAAGSNVLLGNGMERPYVAAQREGGDEIARHAFTPIVGLPTTQRPYEPSSSRFAQTLEFDGAAVVVSVGGWGPLTATLHIQGAVNRTTPQTV